MWDYSHVLERTYECFKCGVPYILYTAVKRKSVDMMKDRIRQRYVTVARRRDKTGRIQKNFWNCHWQQEQHKKYSSRNLLLFFSKSTKGLLWKLRDFKPKCVCFERERERERRKGMHWWGGGGRGGRVKFINPSKGRKKFLFLSFTSLPPSSESSLAAWKSW